MMQQHYYFFRNRFLFLFLVAVLSGSLVFAQTESRKITGTVLDEKGQTLPGVTVLLKGTSNEDANSYGTTTDADGNFSLSVPDLSGTLIFSFIGYVTQEIPINGRSVIEVVFAEDVRKLQEVVVSYGTQKKREITGSITQLEASTLQDMPVAQFSQQLQGKVAGVQINQFSGQPGRGMAFRIRGAASLFADNQPLFVVDGIPITGSISNINPAEIETFTVLKDASSTALYGSRAANGVILITTKHAKPGENKIEFNSYYGVQQIPQNLVPELMNAREFAQFQKEIYEDRVLYEGYAGAIDAVYANPEEYGEGTDWFKTLTQTAPIQSYNLTISSAREKSSSTVVAGYFNQEGVVINTGSQRFSLRFNQDLRLNNDKLKIGFNLAPSYRIDHNNRLDTDGLNAIFQDVVESSPLIAPVNPDGTMPLYVNSPRMVNTINPYAYLTKITDDYKTTRILGNTYLNYEFLKGLAVKTNLAIDKGGETRHRFVPSTIVANGVATGVSSSVDNYSWTAEANLEYTKTFFDDHNIEALIGYSAQKFYQESNSVTGTNFPSDDVPWISAATAISAGDGSTAEYSLLSGIGRLNYNYKGKYLVSGAVRRDGSSRFGANRKYGYFPSLSAGWIVSDESFMRNFNKIDLLKVRASYGVTGNNNIGNYTFIANTGEYNYVLNGALVSGVTISSLGNADLAWERNKQFDIGLDAAILNERVSFTYDYYRKVSDGLIMDRQIPQASGFATIKYNIGVFEFWGHEFTVNSTNLTGRLKWNSNFNISFDRNRIKSLVDPGFLRRNNSTSSDYYRHQEGHAIGEFYGLIYEGLYQDQQDLDNSPQVQWGNWFSDVGTEKMRDVGGPDGVPDGIIDENDRTFIGDPTPDFYFGFTNNFQYRNFDLSISMAGSVGGQIMNGSGLYLTNMYGSRMVLKEVQDRWRSPENPGSGNYPRSMTNTVNIHNQVNSNMLESGTYLAAKNISLGYKLGFENNSVIQDLRLYASVQQAFIITGYSGMNPEANSGGADPTKGIGIDENSYPVPRTITFGINASFK